VAIRSVAVNFDRYPSRKAADGAHATSSDVGPETPMIGLRD